MKNIFEKALEEIKETKELSLPTRKQIWLSYGSVDHHEAHIPPSITEGLIKRITLARKCVEAVLDEWRKSQAGDERPELILNKVTGYLDNKVTLAEVDEIVGKFRDELINLINNNPDNTIYCVGLAACYVADMLFNDDPLLFQDEYPECTDEELDPDMWDASYYSYWVYINQDERANTASRKKSSVKFWIEYLKEAVQLAGLRVDNFDVSDKILQDEEPSYVDVSCEEVTLESFVKKINEDLEYDSIEANDDIIRIIVYQCTKGARCDKCGEFSTQLKSYYGAKMNLPPIDGKEIVLVSKNAMYYCDNKNCKIKFFAARSITMQEEIANYKQFISNPIRREKLCKLLDIEVN